MVGLKLTLFGIDIISNTKRKINVLVLYPNREAIIRSVDVTEKTWKYEDNTYLIDDRAIFFYKSKPLLIYNFGVSSPLVNKLGVADVEYSLNAAEINSVIETKAVRDLLTAGLEDKGWLLYAVLASALFSLINILISLGVIKLK